MITDLDSTHMNPACRIMHRHWKDNPLSPHQQQGKAQRRRLPVILIAEPAAHGPGPLMENNW